MRLGLGIGLAVGQGKTRAAGPALVSATVPMSGLSLVTVWSAAVTGTTADGLTFKDAGVSRGLTYASGSGTTTLTHAVASAVNQGDVCTLDYSGTGLTPSPAAFTGAAVTNNSTNVP